MTDDLPYGTKDRADAAIEKRIRRTERQIDQLTVGDVGEMRAIQLHYYSRGGINERNIDRVEDILSEARIERAGDRR